jgi:hypothetical protein
MNGDTIKVRSSPEAATPKCESIEYAGAGWLGAYEERLHG